MSLEVLIDCAMSRPSKLRSGVSLASHQFGSLVDTWIDPVTSSLWLRPPQLDEAWFTTNSGRYAKEASYSHNNVANWSMVENFPGAGKFAFTNTPGEYAYMTCGLNESFFVSYFVSTAGDATIELEFGYSATFDYTDDLGFRVWSDGRCEVWKNGSKVGEYSIGTTRGQTKQKANIPTTLLVLPHRKREVLVVSSQGGGFIHVFEDIAEDATAPEVAPSGSFWVKNVASTNFAVQLGQIKFPTTGTATSLPIAADLDGTMTFRYFGFEDDIATDISDSSAAATLTGSDLDWAIELTLTGPGSGQTPCFSALHVDRAAIFEDTDGTEEFDLAAYMISARLEVPDDPGGVRFECVLTHPEELDTLVAGLLSSENRPARVVYNGVTILEGVTDVPKFRDGVEDGARELVVTIHDRMKEMADIVFREAYPFDGMALESVAQFLYDQAGIATGEISTTLYEIPWLPPQDRDTDSFQNVAGIGSHLYEEFDRMVEENAKTFLWGMKPTDAGPVGFFLDPDELDPVPLTTLYRSAEEAVLAGAPADQVYWEYDSEPLPIEANEVYATGRNPRTGQALQAFQADEASQDVGLAPSARGDNWLGQPRYFGIVSPRLTTQEACNRAVAYVFPQVSTRYYVDEWRCDAIFKEDGTLAWRGELIDLDGRREVRITSFSIDFVLTSDEYLHALPATYTGGTVLNAGGLGLQAIREMAKARAVNKIVNREQPLKLVRQTSVSLSSAVP